MTISLESLKEAVHLKKNIAVLEGQLAKLLAGVGGAMVGLAETVEGRTKGRRKMSASSRARIAAAQKARWAKQRGTSTVTAAKPAEAGRKKRKISPEGRAKIVAAAKKRWAKAKKK
jgi:hypothetical protein